jgi:hypothetical protein
MDTDADRVRRKTPLKSSMSSGNLYAGLKKSVSFSTVDIREYERTLGNHPDVHRGPPVTFDWNYEQAGSVPLVDYEELKDKPRSKAEMRMTASMRESLLRDCGIPRSELAAALRDISRIKKHRIQTATTGRESAQEVLESAIRKWKRWIKGTSSQGEQEELWQKAKQWALQSGSLDNSRHPADPAKESAPDQGDSTISTSGRNSHSEQQEVLNKEEVGIFF